VTATVPTCVKRDPDWLGVGDQTGFQLGSEFGALRAPDRRASTVRPGDGVAARLLAGECGHQEHLVVIGI
jgi:hypothetical protein